MKREESPPRPISARRPEPWPISDYYRLRERGECVFGPHTSSHVTLGQPTLFSHAQFSPPPESPTFDLGELENTDLDMNRLFFILLANRPARLVLFRQLLFIAVITQNQRSFSSSGSSRASSICSVIIS